MLILISTTTDFFLVYYVNFPSYKTSEKNKNIIITKLDKGNIIVTLDQKLYDNAIPEITSETSKFIKFNKDPTLKCEASLKRFLRKLKQKNMFIENEYDKLYPSSSTPARIYDTTKIHKFSSNDWFPTFHRIVSSIGTFNNILARFLGDLLSPMITLAKILFLLFIKLRMQIFPENFLFSMM